SYVVVAFLDQCRAGFGAAVGAIAFCPGCGGALTARATLCRHSLVHAIVGLGRFPGSDGLRPGLEYGSILPTRPGLDLFLPSWCWHDFAGPAGYLEVAP